MLNQINWATITKDFFQNATRGQALLVQESRKQVARELLAFIDQRHRMQEGMYDPGELVKDIQDFCHAELQLGRG
jgi:hypothetical protein